MNIKDKILVLLILSLLPNVCITAQTEQHKLSGPSIIEITEEQKQQYVRTFIDCIKNDNVDLLKTLVEYPLRRRYPLKRITTQEEFKSKYNEMFDDKLKSEIIYSSPELDWEKTEFNGINLKSFSVGLTNGSKLDHLFLSKVEEERRDSLIKMDRDTLHSSIQHYESPDLQLKTSKSTIRIYITDVEKCSLVIWDKDSSLSTKPKMVIDKGIFYFPATIGTHYSFYRDSYRYEIIIGKDGKHHGKPVEFITYKNNKIISREPAIELLD